MRNAGSNRLGERALRSGRRGGLPGHIVFRARWIFQRRLVAWGTPLPLFTLLHVPRPPPLRQGPTLHSAARPEAAAASAAGARSSLRCSSRGRRRLCGRGPLFTPLLVPRPPPLRPWPTSLTLHSAARAACPARSAARPAHRCALPGPRLCGSGPPRSLFTPLPVPVTPLSAPLTPLAVS